LKLNIAPNLEELRIEGAINFHENVLHGRKLISSACAFFPLQSSV
jgi:hypothetical protein